MIYSIFLKLILTESETIMYGKNRNDRLFLADIEA